ncbi:MAG: hypothetical protein COB02_16515 [Candidatus Cloacimonadota bacterium]|nr:MAG: hypothetical protein COB02_16515 [Candidatus Cloacimonadota bacterium]
MNLKISYKDYQFVSSKQNTPYLMISLHGRGDTFFGMRKIKHKLKLDNMNYLFLNAPDEWITDTGFLGKSWYERPPHHNMGLKKSLNLLSQLIIELNSQGINQIYLNGFSQGSVLGLEYILRYPNDVKGFFGMSGFIFREQELSQLDSNNPTNVFLTHGLLDEVLNAQDYKNSLQKISNKFISFTYEDWNKLHLIDDRDIRLMKSHINQVFDIS